MRLRIVFPDDPMMQVSHETIYQSLFVQGRGELRRELTRCLRSGADDLANTRGGPLGAAPDHRHGHALSQRPAEATTVRCPGTGKAISSLGPTTAPRSGHWSSAVPPRLALAPPHTVTTPRTSKSAMCKAIATLPSELARSVTWDQGTEMATHANFTVRTGVPVYFCDPHSPWQRGSNQNTNGLLRQYMPKFTDL